MTAPGSYNANVVLSADVSNYQQGMAQAAQSTQQTTSAINKLGAAYTDTKNKVKGKFIEFDRGAVATLAAGTAAAALYQKQLSTLNATAANSGQSFKQMKAGIDQAFASLPVARTDLVNLATQLTQTGVTSSQEVGKMIVTFEKLAAATGGSASSLASSMVQFTNAMGDQTSGNINAMANSLTNLAAKEGVAAQNIANFAQAIAPLARVSGITENQVLGLSTAFSKAGADGYVAANTFNSMLENIAQLASTGAPELAKYANVLGLTVQQFNNLPRAQAVAEIFQAINSQGQQGITTLNNLGVNGVRSISALQAVVSQGDLSNLVQGGSTTNGALDKGANAAWNNLADSLARTRNEMTQYGTYIGTTFLTPLTAAVNVVNTLVKALNMLKPVLAVPLTVAGMVGTTLGPLIQFAAPLVAMRWLRAGPIGRGLRGGFGAGRRVGASPEEIAAYQSRYAPGSRVGPMNMSNEEIDRQAAVVRAASMEKYTQQGYAAEDAARMAEKDVAAAGFFRGTTQRWAYGVAANFGSNFSKALPAVGSDASAFIRGMGNRVATAPLWATRAIIQAQSNYLQNTYRGAGIFGTAAASYETPRTDALFGRIGGLGTGLRGAATSGWENMRAGNWSYFNPLASQRFTAARAFFGAGNEGGGGGVSPEGQALVTSARTLKSEVDTGAKSAGVALEQLTAKIRQHLEQLQAQITEEGKNTTTMKALATESAAAARALAEFTGAEIKASVGALGATARALPGSSIVGGIARFGGNMIKELFSSPLFVTMMGAMGGMYAWGKYKDYASGQADLSGQYLNPIQKYNEQLGIASTNLADFNNNLNSANNKLQKAVPNTFGQAATFTRSEFAAAPNKVTNPIWTSVANSGLSGDALTNLGVAVLGSMPLTDARQMDAIQKDMAAAGLSQVQVQQISQAYMSQGGPNAANGGLARRVNYARLGQAVGPTEGIGYNLAASRIWQDNNANQSAAGAQYLQTGLTALQSAYQNNIARYGGGYASLMRLQNVGQLFGPLTQWANIDPGSLIPGIHTHSGGPFTAGGYTHGMGFKGAATREAMARELSRLTGGGYGDYLDALRSEKSSMGFAAAQQAYADHSKNAPMVAGQAIISLLNKSSEGQKFLQKTAQAAGIPISQINSPDFFKTLQTRIINQQNANGSDFNKMLMQAGPLGEFSASSSSIQNAIGVMQGSPGATYHATNQLYAAAMAQNNGNLEKSSAALERLAEKTNDLTGPFAQLALAAKGVAQQWLGYKIPTMSRNQQMGVYISELNSAMNANPNATDYTQNLKAAQDQYQQGKESYRQYLISMYQQEQQYITQSRQAEQDYHTQVNRSNKAFYLQQEYAQQDFHRQMYRAKRDYNQQMRFAAQQSAQSIMDPYSRIQPVQTMGSGNLLFNLQDQNQALKRQWNEIKYLQSLGLSKEAIRELNLTDPNNAQQLDRLAWEARAGETGWIVQVNAATAKRVRLTKTLTQNDFNLQFKQTNQQFTQGLHDAQKDYERAQKRARHAQQQSLDYMAHDYNRMVRRSAHSLRQAFRELHGDFGKWFAKTMQLTVSGLHQYAPAAANEIDRVLTNLEKKHPELMDNTYGAPSVNTTTGATTAEEISGGVPSGYGGSRPSPPSSYRRPNSQIPTGVAPPPHPNEYNSHYHHHRHHQHHFPTLGHGIGHASGGISTWEHNAMISEGNRAEAIIPLDWRGQSFMVGMYNAVARSVAQQLRTHGHATPGNGHVYNIVKHDNSAKFTGPITVEAQDTKQMLADLSRQQRLNRLSSAGRHTGAMSL